jgi:hypothetical protein
MRSIRANSTMSEILSERTTDELIVAVRALEKLSALDLVYADQYLYRAEMLLPRLLTRDEYVELRCSRTALTQATRDLRRAIDANDWSHVRTLAARAPSHR